jgi:hypothetical protein
MSSFYRELVDFRGGCTCHLGHPPCGNCCRPVTDEEVDYLFDVVEGMYNKAEKIIKDEQDYVIAKVDELERKQEKELYKLFTVLTPGNTESFLHQETFKHYLAEIRANG